MRRVSFGVAVSEDVLGEGTPVPFQGGLLAGMGRAAELGFETVEFHVHDPQELDADGLRAEAERLGLRIAAIGTGLEHGRYGLSLTSPDANVRAEAARKLRLHIDFAQRVGGAVVFLGLIRGRCGVFERLGATLDLLAEELKPVAAYAAEHGVPTGFEPVAYYFSDLLTRTDETLEFLARPGLEPIGLLLDTHHMFLEDPDIPAALRASAGRIQHVHLSDSNRRYPGAGNVDFDEVARVLTEIGYDHSVSLEILPIPTGDDAAQRGLARMRAIWGA